MHIAISNVYSDANRGGSLLTLAAYNLVQRIMPDSRVTFLSTGSGLARDYDVTLKHCKDALVEPNPVPIGSGLADWLRRSMLIGRSRHYTGSNASRLLARGSSLPKADAVIGKGGQLFRAYSGPRQIRSFLSSSYPLAYAIERNLPAVAYGVQVSAGKYPDRAAVARVVSQLSLVVARDPRSAENAERMGCERVLLAPDTVFGLKIPAEQGSVNDRAESRYAVFIANHQMATGFHFERATKLLESMLAACSVGRLDHILIIHQANVANQLDDRAAQALAGRVDDPRVRLVPGVHSPMDLLDLYGAAAFTVSGRVHGSIMSLLAGTPSFVIDTTDDKALHLFAGMGLERFVLNMDGSKDDEFEMQVREIDFFGSERARLLRDVQRLHEQVRAVDAEVARILTPGPPN